MALVRYVPEEGIGASGSCPSCPFLSMEGGWTGTLAHPVEGAVVEETLPWAVPAVVAGAQALATYA